MPNAIRFPGWLRFAPFSGSSLILVELLLAGAIGVGLLALGADGSAWMLGGILAGAIAFATYHRHTPQAKPNCTARKVGQMLVGLMVGFAIQASDWSSLVVQLPLFLLLTSCLLAGGAAIGVLYARLSQVDCLTGILATTPGNVAIMASVAADYGKNPALVSFTQLLRFTAVTSLIPLLAQTNHHADLNHALQSLLPTTNQMQGSYLLWLVGLLAIAWGSIQVGKHLKIPVPGLMCPLLVGSLFEATVTILPLVPPVAFQPPSGFNVLGQILLGITIGEYWGQNPRLSKSAIAHGALSAGLMTLMGLVTAGIAMMITPWDWLTCLLITSPGGSPEMIWMALVLDRNVELVTAGHLVRLIVLNLVLPLMITGAAAIDDRHLRQTLTPSLQKS